MTAQVKPLAQGLGATVRRHARPTVGHAVSAASSSASSAASAGASAAVESVTSGGVAGTLLTGASPLS
ncbi:hypothetical protein [Streptomyces sp. NPDC088348]|uniref:hypothetical protein n=1 Tax=Streptomyces sp. NPDC088348 TaxID=3365853 RepID=UPI00381DA3F9